MTDAQRRGFELYVNKGRCVSCHLIEQTQALFTDNRFHNVGVGINDIQGDVPELVDAFLEADLTLSEVDVKVLSDARTSELGRFAVDHLFEGLGAFKTPTLRNIADTAPYMHDGSMKTLREVVEFYSKGGQPNPYLDRKIDRRFAESLDFNEDEINILVKFMEALDGGTRSRGDEPIRVLWITPLRALATDTVEHLRESVAAVELPWTVELRTGE